MANRLSLDISVRNDNFDKLESTYRDEGLSVGADHMRLYGEDVHLEVSFNDLIMGKTIGHGACSSVNIARHKRSSEQYAVKLFNIYDRAQASQLYNEILLLTSFSCDALISLKGAFHDQGSIGVILEYMDRGSLEFILHPSINLPEDVMAAISFQVLWGCGYLHHEKQIHRDIKPGNALMNSLGQVKLSDFGISKALDHTTAMSNSAVGSYMYMSPERLLGDKYDASADVWSVGVSVVQLFTKKYPFQKVAQTPVHLSGELESFDVIKFARGPVCSSMSNTMKQFIVDSMNKEPRYRQSCMSLVFEGPWFSSHGLQSLEQCHERVSRWLRGVDRQRQQMVSSASVSTAQQHRNYPQQSQQQRQKAAAIVRDVMEQSMEMSQSFRFNHNNNNNNNSQSIGGNSGYQDHMEMSLDQSYNRKPNPFMSSGSLTSSQVINMSHALNSYNQEMNTRNNYQQPQQVGSQQYHHQHHHQQQQQHHHHDKKMTSMMEDEIYDDDFEADEMLESYEQADYKPSSIQQSSHRSTNSSNSSGHSSAKGGSSNSSTGTTGRASDRWRSNGNSRAESKSDSRPASGNYRRY